MPKEFPRTLRVGEQIHRELAALLHDEIKDPRIGMVTIADVEVSRDLAHAKVYFTVMGDESLIDSSATGLRSAAGFLRHELARRLHVRTVPELRFIYDDTQRQGEHISRLIDNALHPQDNG